MCLLALKPLGEASVPADGAFALAAAANRDGVGVAYSDGTRVHVRKFPAFRDFQAWHASAPYRADPAAHAVVWHFRMATSGPVSAAMCHPFALSPDASEACAEGPTALPVAAHNGVLSSLDFPRDPSESDTLSFVRRTLSALPLRGESHGAAVLGVLGAAVGPGNRLAIVWPDGAHAIVNESRGSWDGGVWYSGNRGAPAAPPPPLPAPAAFPVAPRLMFAALPCDPMDADVEAPAALAGTGFCPAFPKEGPALSWSLGGPWAGVLASRRFRDFLPGWARRADKAALSLLDSRGHGGTYVADLRAGRLARLRDFSLADLAGLTVVAVAYYPNVYGWPAGVGEDSWLCDNKFNYN